MKRNVLMTLLVSTSLLAVAACGGDSEETQPPDTALPDTGTDVETDTATDAGTDTDDTTVEPDADAALPDTGDADVTPPDDVVPDTDGSSDPPDVEPDVPVDCDGDGTCWVCEPTNEEELLNACTDAPGVVFDNAARLPRLNDDGTLPPLP